MCDVFEEFATGSHMRRQLLSLIDATPVLQWLLLTKRPENILRHLDEIGAKRIPSNVWIGTSIESEALAHRADALSRVPARIRFISYEPALGPLDRLKLDGIHWVIYGGESGPGRRDDKIEWARTMRDQCKKAGVAFFMKQRSGSGPGHQPTIDGETIQEFPA